METTYVISGKEIYKDMTKFWGKLFGINFALGVTTGLTMEFQFGTNWAYYSHYVGDIFGAPLAIEGLMAFFLESTFIGLFFFGWDRLSKVQHLGVTWLVALGSNMSAHWNNFNFKWFNGLRPDNTFVIVVLFNCSCNNTCYTNTVAAHSYCKWFAIFT